MSNDTANLEGVDFSAQSQSNMMLVGFSSDLAAEIVESLSSLNWNVLSERDSHQAIEHCTVSQFDFVLLDVDGVNQFAPKTVRDLRANASLSKGSTVVALGKLFMAEFKEQLTESGVDGFCLFPVDAGKLVACLTEASVRRALSTRDVSTFRK